jgi:fructose-specific phosphotransferase system IIC component
MQQAMRNAPLTRVVPFAADNPMHVIPVDICANILVGAAYACLMYASNGIAQMIVPECINASLAVPYVDTSFRAGRRLSRRW